MTKKNIKLSIILTAMLVSIVGIVVGTNAYFSSKDEVTNAFVSGDVDIEVDEKFDPPENWKGESYDKKVKVKNNGNVNTLIRVAIVSRWVDENGKAWAGDTNIIKLNWASANIADASTSESNKWIDGGDGYYYYNTLVSKDGSTEILLESVSADIPKELQDRYTGKKLIVDVKAEAVQATKEAYEKTWSNISNDSIKTMLNNLCNK